VEPTQDAKDVYERNKGRPYFHGMIAFSYEECGQLEVRVCLMRAQCDAAGRRRSVRGAKACRFARTTRGAIMR
jgi:hypothetical protein